MNLHHKSPGLSTTQSLSQIIGSMAVMAAVQAKSLGMTRLDKQASIESDVAHGAIRGAGKTSVNRLPGAKAAVDAIKATHSQARTLVAGWTSRWGEDRRLLMNEHIGEVGALFEEIRVEHDRLRDQFVADSWAYIHRAHQDLGSYTVAPPSQDEIAHAFSLSLEMSPVPNIDAWTGGGGALEQSMRKRFEADIKAAWDGAQKDLLKRLIEPLDKLVERMNAYEERELLKEKDIDVGKEGTFKATVVTNITDIGRIFRSFSQIGDPVITEFADRLEAFEGIGHADLTKSAQLRAATAKQAADIRASLSAWL